MVVLVIDAAGKKALVTCCYCGEDVADRTAIIIATINENYNW